MKYRTANTTMKTTLVFLLIVIGLILVRFLTLPNPVQEIVLSKCFTRPMYSHTVYSGPDVDTTKIHKAKIYKGFFALDKSLDPDETRAVINILLDTANYDINGPGENLSAKELIFTYFDIEGSMLGSSHLSPRGDLISIPHDLFGATGYLTSDGLQKLRGITGL